KAIADYSSQTDDGGFGAAWSDEDGNTYFFNNGSGKIYRAAFNEQGEILSFAFISTSEPNGSNDGMGCALAQAPVFPEICDNGLDDDGDGLVDCEDPDCTASEKCGVSGVVYGSTYACTESLATYHTFFTNNSTLTNTVTITEQLPNGFVFVQDSLSFDAGGSSSFTFQPIDGDIGTLKWGPITLNGKETVKISYDVVINEGADTGAQFNQVTAELDREGTQVYPTSLSTEILVGDCPTPNTYTCEPAFYQVYKKKGKNQPNVFGKLDPITGDYDAIAIASDFANGLGYDINSGLVYGASGNRFVQLDQDGIVIDQGIRFNKKVYRGDINQNSEWYGVDGSDMVKIDVSGTPRVIATYAGQGLQGWDIAYNNDGHFYSVHNTSLYQFNTETNTKNFIAELSGSSIPTSGGYGAQWTGSDDYLYISHNKTGKIIRVDVLTGEARVVSLSTDGLSLNDGFSCPTEIPVVFEFDYGDNNRLPQSRILAYRQDISFDDIPDFSTFWFGNTVNYDLSDPANANADGDLDDGLTLSTEIDNGTLSAVIGLNTNIEGTAHYLIGVDWDDNGTFDDILNESISMNTARTIIKDINVPDGYEGGFINLRIIISEDELSNSNISGEVLLMGEVEDYRYEISLPCTGDDCEVTTGANGGLESNGSLANAIAKRNYSRVKNNDKSYLRVNQPVMAEYKMARTSSQPTSNYFPEQGHTGNEEARVSTPEDLIEITNAENVFALDYYLEKKRVAASLFLSTTDQVYNHSKNVCDRLNGKSIEEARVVNLDGVNVVYAKIRNESGAIEYSAWFSAKDNDSNYEVYSLWNVDNYPSGKYMNFQAWSSSPAQVFHILKYALAQLRSEKELSGNKETQQLPGVFVKSGQYRNGQLVLSVVNNSQATSIEIEANLRATEQADLVNELFPISLTGAAEEEVIVNTGYLFDAGVSVRVENEEAYDALYLADGAWGTDFNPSVSTIEEFQIYEVVDAPELAEYLIERDFTLSAKSSDVINVFRNVKAGEKTLNISSYSTIRFDIQNNTPIEIVLVEKGLDNWEDRLKVTIPVHEEMNTVALDLQKFNIENVEEIQTIVFSYLNQSGTEDHVKLSVSNLSFGNETILGAQNELSEAISFSVYPNPTIDYIKVNSSDLTTNGALTIVDLSGKVVLTKEIKATDLNTRICISLPSGIYQIVLETNAGLASQLLKVK
ncbi:MAG: T9SS type A sorting domain-containing protein, partial [Ekhidna sp.]